MSAEVLTGSYVSGRLLRSGMRLLLLQLVFGVLNVLLRLPIELTALHSALAVALVLVTGLVVREVVYARAGVPSFSNTRGEALGIG